LDVSMRLGRYLIQELLGIRNRIGGIIATLATVAIPLYMAFYAKSGSYLDFWTLFGASNQLLAGLTLLSITAWLYKARQRIAFTLLPMLFVLTITLWALTKLAIGNLQASTGIDVKMFNGIAAIALVSLAIFLIITALLKLRNEKQNLEPIQSV
jgi:carbon starvation protein